MFQKVAVNLLADWAPPHSVSEILLLLFSHKTWFYT